MKNPYRQFLQLPLRNTIFATLAPLFVAKVVVFILYSSDPESVPLPWHSPWPMVAIALSAIPDLLPLYYVSAGWYDLDRRPWAILPSPVLNFFMGAGLVGLASILVINSRALGSLSGVQILGTAVAAMVLILGLTQLIASLMLHKRVRLKPAAK